MAQSAQVERIQNIIAISVSTVSGQAKLGQIQRRVQEVNNATSYVGWAIPNNLEENLGWTIQRIQTDQTITKLEWAEGSWSNRASLTYV